MKALVLAFSLIVSIELMSENSSDAENIFAEGVSRSISENSTQVFQGINLIEESARLGYVEAIRRLTWIYSSGFGLSEEFQKTNPSFYPNYEKVVYWTKTLALEYDQLPEIFGMAIFYRDGIGTEKNSKESGKYFSLFRKRLDFLENNSAIKLDYLAKIYLCGYGVNIDIEKFHEILAAGVKSNSIVFEDINSKLSSGSLTPEIYAQDVCI